MTRFHLCFFLALANALVLCCTIVGAEEPKMEAQASAHASSIFPHTIPLYPHRRDRNSGEEVSLGRLYLLGVNLDSQLPPEKRVSINQLRQVLQCSADEPDILGDRGTLDLVKMAVPSRDTVRLVAVWAETGCENWRECRSLLSKFQSKEDGYGTEIKKQSRSGGKMTSPFQVRMLRVMNGSLSYDWPFDNKQRFGDKDFVSKHHFLIHQVLGKTSDVGDSVFLFGEEVAYLPFNTPFFAFSNSPSFKHGDIPWPWRAHQASEAAIYKDYLDDALLAGVPISTSSGNSSIIISTQLRAALAALNAHTDTHAPLDEESWRQRKSTAAFYGAMSSLRHIFFDVAAANPSLLAAGWTGAINSKPWNPLSDEADVKFDDLKQAVAKRRNSTTPGFINTLLQSHLFEGHRVTLFHSGSTKGLPPTSPAQQHKYLVVLVGGSGHASADRLASMMLHSGSVLLLQKHEFEYHFSSRLKPWVHYVPLTYSAADVVEKVKWLQRNDHLALILAKNARTFARSHLRLEDLVCYAATALTTMASVLHNSTATQPFEPIELPFTPGEF